MEINTQIILTDIQRRNLTLKIFHAVKELIFEQYKDFLVLGKNTDMSKYHSDMKQKLEDLGAEFLDMNIKPFGVFYKLPRTETDSELTCQLIIKQGNYSWQRVKK